jgi:serine/threonine-protein kinase
MLGDVSEPTAGMLVSSNVRLLRPLGEGGMGRVWIAEHRSLRTKVVVKFMARELAQSPEAVTRFSREAAAASQVKSPHVVQMLDHGVLENGSPYIVMELLEGRDLEEQIRVAGPLDARDVVAIVAQLARALAKAHERGIVHRDIKPSNVFLCDAGGGELFVKLLDFGIAKDPQGVLAGSTTRSGSFLGSPFYMSPEQVVGSKTVDYRTDLWSLAVVAFESLTGEKPFFAETVGALALKIHRDPIPAPSSHKGALGAAVDAWFAKACAREPAERFGSAKEMAEAFAVAVTGEAARAAAFMESLPRPDAAAPADAGADTLPEGESKRTPSGVDARSETGAGVGISSRDRAASSRSRGKWVGLGVVLVAVLSVGWLVPRLATRSVASAGSAAVAASDSAPWGAAVAGASLWSAVPSFSAGVVSSAPASTSAAAPAFSSAHAPTSAAPQGASSRSLRGRTPALPAASSAPNAPASTPSARTNRTAGSDDDIK